MPELEFFLRGKNLVLGTTEEGYSSYNQKRKTKGKTRIYTSILNIPVKFGLPKQLLQYHLLVLFESCVLKRMETNSHQHWRQDYNYIKM